MDNLKTQNCKSLPLFEGMPDDQIDPLINSGSFVSVQAGDLLFEMGARADYVYLIIFGAMKLCKPNHEMVDSIINFVWRGALLGSLVAENMNAKYPINAIALEETCLFKIPKQAYLELWMKNGTIRSRIQNQLMQRVLDMQKDKEMITAPALVRVSEFLVRLISLSPANYSNKTCFKLTRTDVAARLNLTVETVIRTMSKLTKENIIETKEHHIYVLDMKKLVDYSNTN